MKNYPEMAKELGVGLGELAKAEPAVMKGFSDLMGNALKDGALSKKTKEMIIVAIAITVRCDGCIAHHVKAVYDLGVTREELVEIIGVAQSMGGGPSTVYGVEALNAYDQFAKK